MANLVLGFDIPGPGIKIHTAEPIGSQRVSLDTTLYFDTQDLPGNQGIAIGPVRGVMELTADEFDAWEGYDLDLFGTDFDHSALPPGVALPSSAPTWTINWADEGLPASTVLLWRQRTRHKQSPLRAEQLWLPNGLEHYSIRILEPDATYSRAARDAAFRGLALLRGHPLLPAIERATRRGRSDEEALCEAVEWANEWLKRHPNNYPNDIAHPQLHETSGMTPKSTDNFLNRHHITLPKIRRALS